MSESEVIARRSAESIAGGVVSLNRKVDPAIAFVRAQGSRLWDADGKEYIDYHAAFAPHILGHNDPEVNATVRDAMERGWSLMGSGPTPWELKLADGTLAVPQGPGLGVEIDMETVNRYRVK